MKICYNCKKKLDLKDKIGRLETCTFCGADLHVCRNCRFHDPRAYNECLETMAERVVDKERSNFCEYFLFGEKEPSRTENPGTRNARERLEDLFKG